MNSISRWAFGRRNAAITHSQRSNKPSSYAGSKAEEITYSSLNLDVISFGFIPPSLGAKLEFQYSENGLIEIPKYNSQCWSERMLILGGCLNRNQLTVNAWEKAVQELGKVDFHVYRLHSPEEWQDWVNFTFYISHKFLAWWSLTAWRSNKKANTLVKVFHVRVCDVSSPFERQTKGWYLFVIIVVVKEVNH